MPTTSSKSVVGKFESRLIDEATSGATVHVDAASATAHWQVLEPSGRLIVAFNIGRVYFHLSPKDAEEVGYMLAAIAADAQASAMALEGVAS